MLLLKNVSKTYITKNSQKVLAIKDFSFEFQDTGLYLLIGKSGSGKSTLAKIIALLERDYEGEIFFNGISYQQLKGKTLENFRNENICYISQNENVIDYLNVYDNIKICFELRKVKINQKIIFGLLDSFKLRNVSNKFVHQISGGEKQRLSILRKIILPYKMFLLDEPTSFLDENNKEIIFNLLNEISKEKLIIVIAHDFINQLNKCKEIIKINEGKIIEISQNKDYFSKTTSKEFCIENKNNKFTLFKLILKKIKFNKMNFFGTFLINLILLFTCFAILSIQKFNLSQSHYQNLLNQNFDYFEINTLKNNSSDEIEKYIEKYNLSYNNFVFNLEIKKIGKTLKGIEENQFFNHYQLIYGSFPKCQNEIIIYKHKADDLIKKSKFESVVLHSYEDLFHSVSFYTPSKKEFKIVGIIENEKKSDLFVDYFINKEFIKNMNYQIYHLETQENDTDFSEKNRILGFTHINNEQSALKKSFNISDCSNFEKTVFLEEKKTNLEKNEIIISLDVLKELIEKSDFDFDILLNKKIREYVLENYFSVEQDYKNYFNTDKFDPIIYENYILNSEINVFDPNHSYKNFWKTASTEMIQTYQAYLFDFNFVEIKNLQYITLESFKVVGVDSANYADYRANSSTVEKIISLEGCFKRDFKIMVPMYNFKDFEFVMKNFHQSSEFQLSLNALLALENQNLAYKLIKKELNLVLIIISFLVIFIGFLSNFKGALNHKKRTELYQLTGLNTGQIKKTIFLEIFLIFIISLIFYLSFISIVYRFLNNYTFLKFGVRMESISLILLVISPLIVFPFTILINFIPHIRRGKRI